MLVLISKIGFWGYNSCFRCVLLDAKEAEDKHVQLVHSKNHVKLIKNISSKQFDSRRARTASMFNSIYFNEGSSEAAYLAAGSVVEVLYKDFMAL